MGLRSMALRRPRNGLIALLTALVAAFLVLGIPAGAALAETTDDGQEVTDFYFAGNITFEGEPIPGVGVSVEGNGFEGETETDADGKVYKGWSFRWPEDQARWSKEQTSSLGAENTAFTRSQSGVLLVMTLHRVPLSSAGTSTRAPSAPRQSRHCAP